MEVRQQPELTARKAEHVSLSVLKPHPKNYRVHPDDEIEHLMQSIREHGIYRNIVVAKDYTILAGHGVAEAAKRLGYQDVPVVKLPIKPDDPRALKLLVADNEIAHLVENDDRQLSELLKQIKDFDVTGLLGTGYDDMMLANLIYVTRPASEIGNLDAAAEWVGMPAYDGDTPEPWRLIVNFDDESDRAAFAAKLGITLADSQREISWPAKPNDDIASVKIVG